MFGKIFGGLKKAARVTVKTALPIAIVAVNPAAIINTVVMGGLKHTPMLKDNNKIPYINLLLSSMVSYGRHVASTGDWVASLGPALQEGGALMGISTALHQSMKLPIKKATGRSI